LKKVLGGRRAAACRKRQKFDLSGKGPNGAAIEMEGIYEVTAEKFRLCYLLKKEGKKRPKEFKTAPKSGHVFLEFKPDRDE
jgi:hypothetical protein